MSNTPKNPDPKAPESKTVQKPSPEAETAARVSDLQARLQALNLEIRSAKGRLANADPMTLRILEKENEQLRARETVLRKALFGMILDAEKPRQQDEIEIGLEVLRRAAVEYCKKANVAPEIWKNIES